MITFNYLAAVLADITGMPTVWIPATPPEVVEQIETGSVEDLAEVTVPTLIIPGTDSRHPTALGATLARVLPQVS